MVKLFANICHVEIIATERSFTCDVKKIIPQRHTADSKNNCQAIW